MSTEAAVSSPPVTGRGLRPGRRWPRRRALGWMALGVLLLGTAAWAVPHHPWYLERRLSRMSVEQLQSARAGRLDDPRLLFHLGRKLNDAGRFTEADPLLRHAVGILPESPRLRDQWTRALLGSGLTTAAYGQLREFAGRYPDLPEAHFLLGRFYYSQSALERACEEFRSTVRRKPGHAEAWSHLAAALDGLRDLEGARLAIEKAIALRPGQPGWHLLLASLLDRTHRTVEAGRHYTRAAELARREGEPHRELAAWLLKTSPRSLDRAEEAARRALSLAPRDSQAHLVLGRILRESGRQAEAAAALERAAGLAPEDPAPALAVAQVSRELGREGSAREWEQRYLSRQRLAERKRQLYEGIRVDPKNPELHRRMARILARSGDVEGCIRHHSAAASLPRDAPPTLASAANDLTESGYASRALPLADRAVAMAVSNPAAYEARAHSLLALGRIFLAGQDYNRAATWWPHRVPEWKRRLARAAARRQAHPPPAERAYREARRLERSMVGPKRFSPDVERYARRAAELEPHNPDYLWYLLRVQMARRANEEALRTADLLLALAPEEPRARAIRGLLRVESARGPEELAAAEEDLEAAAGEPTAAATRHYGLGLLALRRRQGTLAARELRRALEGDPHADVTYYKLFLAERMAGREQAAGKALAEFRQRQERRRRQAQALGEIARRPDRPEHYLQAAGLFDAQGLRAEAAAIRAEARRRFGSGSAGKRRRPPPAGGRDGHSSIPRQPTGGNTHDR